MFLVPIVYLLRLLALLVAGDGDAGLAEGALVLHVKPLPEAGRVEQVAAAGDACLRHVREADGAHVVVRQELLRSCARKTRNFLCCFQSEEEAFPALLQALEYVEVAVDDEHQHVHGRPLARQGLLHPGPHHEHGNDELKDSRRGPSVVNHIVESRPCLSAQGVVSQEAVGGQQPNCLQ